MFFLFVLLIFQVPKKKTKSPVIIMQSYLILLKLFIAMVIGVDIFMTFGILNDNEEKEQENPL